MRRNMNKKPLRAAVLGATGYTGQQLTSLLGRHPRIDAAFVTSESSPGQRVQGASAPCVRAADVPLGDVDVVFSCLPHGEAEPWAVRAREAGAKVVDLSADLRDGRHGAVYGLTELRRDEVRGADMVANPGCYPTGVLLALSPLLAADLVDRARPVMVDAASGVTGAGRTPKPDLLFGEVAEDYRAYGVGNGHRHVPEMSRGLERAAGDVVELVFTPHLLPVRRGILETMYVPVRADVDAADVVGAWQEWYGDEPFVELWTAGLPSLHSAVHRNVVALGATDVAGVASPLVIVVASLDNLIKGAAGQAIQNANLMLGLEEREGLPL
jgi:N-acetyl-gamma-glutamyl-phosphate reductase